MLIGELRDQIWSAQAELERMSDHLDIAEQMVEKLDPYKTVRLPCLFGERLWWCIDDENNDGRPTVEQSDPVKGFLIEPGGKISATFDFVCYDEVGGPELFATEAEARAEQARRFKELQKKGEKNEP